MRILLFLFLSLSAVPLFAQHNHQHTEGHQHAHGEWELGGAIGVVPLLDEGEIAPGLHLHLLQQNKMIPKLMVGVGFEAVMDEHTHLTAGLVFNYNIYKGLYAAVSPGLLWINHDGWESAYVTHFELSYEFEVGKLHIGPIVEYSYASLDKHVMLGVHVGVGF